MAAARQGGKAAGHLPAAPPCDHLAAMDNLTHTLVGAALGRAGLARRTRFGMAALLVGANLPDLDVLGIPFGWNLGFRRGVTHGLPALLVWPFLLALALVLWHRWRHGGRTAIPAPAPRELLLLGAIGITSHPLLDWFNSYGMRWLMPLRGTWFYGDTWFIVDPWVLAVLGAGVWLSRPRTGASPREGPARAALAVAALYAVAMWAGSQAGERRVRTELAGLGFAEPAEVMVTPVALNPLRRLVVIDDGGAYWRGSLKPGGPLRLDAAGPIPKGLDELDLGRLRAGSAARQFLGWSRFPFARVRREGDTVVVTLDDARYSGGEGGSFARTVVRLPPRP